MTKPALQRLRFELTDGAPAPAWPAGHTVRTLQPDDAPAVHRLMRAGYAQGGGDVAEFEAWWPTLRDDSEFDLALCFLAFDPGGRLVGVIQCWTSSFVKDLVVLPDARRLGLGEALLRTAFEALRGRGHSAVDLKVRTDNRHGARELYAKLGGRPVAIDG